MKAYMGSGFTPLVVQRNKALYFDIAERHLLACSVAFRALAVLCSNNLLKYSRS
jgi:hypothetical protein